MVLPSKLGGRKVLHKGINLADARFKHSLSMHD